MEISDAFSRAVHSGNVKAATREVARLSSNRLYLAAIPPDDLPFITKNQQSLFTIVVKLIASAVWGGTSDARDFLDALRTSRAVQTWLRRDPCKLAQLILCISSAIEYRGDTRDSCVSAFILSLIEGLRPKGMLALRQHLEAAGSASTRLRRISREQARAHTIHNRGAGGHQEPSSENLDEMQVAMAPSLPGSARRPAAGTSNRTAASASAPVMPDSTEQDRVFSVATSAVLQRTGGSAVAFDSTMDLRHLLHDVLAPRVRNAVLQRIARTAEASDPVLRPAWTRQGVRRRGGAVPGARGAAQRLGTASHATGKHRGNAAAGASPATVPGQIQGYRIMKTNFDARVRSCGLWLPVQAFKTEDGSQAAQRHPQADRTSARPGAQGRMQGGSGSANQVLPPASSRGTVDRAGGLDPAGISIEMRRVTRAPPQVEAAAVVTLQQIQAPESSLDAADERPRKAPRADQTAPAASGNTTTALLQPMAASSCPVRVFSDVDDTAFGNYLDYSIGPRIVYPGMPALYHAVQGTSGAAAPGAGGRQGRSSQQPDQDQIEYGSAPMGHVAFVTARPPAMRADSITNLEGRLGPKRLGVSVLPGSACSLWTSEMMAARKLEHLTEQADLWPDCRFVWIGDSGQGDVHLGKVARRKFAGELGREPPVCLIHDVCLRDGLGMDRKTGWQDRARLASEGVFLFDSRAGAALIAAQCGLCDIGKALGVAAAEACEFAREVDGLYSPGYDDGATTTPRDADAAGSTSASVRTGAPEPVSSGTWAQWSLDGLIECCGCLEGTAAAASAHGHSGVGSKEMRGASGQGKKSAVGVACIADRQGVAAAQCDAYVWHQTRHCSEAKKHRRATATAGDSAVEQPSESKARNSITGCIAAALLPKEALQSGTPIPWLGQLLFQDAGDGLDREPNQGAREIEAAADAVAARLVDEMPREVVDMLARAAAATHGAHGGAPWQCDRGTLPLTPLNGMNQPAPASAHQARDDIGVQHVRAAGAQETPLLPLPAVEQAAVTRHTTRIGRMLVQSLLRCSQAVCNGCDADSTNFRAASSGSPGGVAAAGAMQDAMQDAMEGEAGSGGAAPPTATPAGSSSTSLRYQHILLRVGMWGYSPWRNHRFRLAWEAAEQWHGSGPVAGIAGGACCACSGSWGCCDGCSSSERPGAACGAALWDCKTYFCCCCCCCCGGGGASACSGLVARGVETEGRGNVQGGNASIENDGTSNRHQELAGLGVAARRRYRRWLEHEDACIRLLVACALVCGAAAGASSLAGI